MKNISHLQAVKFPSTLACYKCESPVHNANLKVKLIMRFCLAVGWKSVSMYIFSLWLWRVAEYSLSLCLLTQSLMEEKSYLKGWQRVRQLPDLFLKMVLFSACLSFSFSMGNVSTPAPCPRCIAEQDILYPGTALILPLFFLIVLCFAFSCSGVQPCRDSNRTGRKLVVGRIYLIFLFALRHCCFFQQILYQELAFK